MGGGGGYDFSKIFLQLVANDKQLQESLKQSEAQAVKTAAAIESSIFKSFHAPASAASDTFRRPNEEIDAYLKRLAGIPAQTEQQLAAPLKKTFEQTAEAAKKSATTVDQAFGEAFRRIRGEGGAGPAPGPGGGAGVPQTEQARIVQLEQRRAEIADQRAKGLLNVAGAEDKASRATETAGRAVRTANQQLRQGGQVVGQLAANILGQLNPALGQVAAGGARAAASAASMGVGFGLAVGAVIALSQVISHYIERIQKAIEFNAQLALGLRNLDAGAAAAALNQVAAAQEKAGASAQVFNEQTGIQFLNLKSIVSGINLLSTNFEELAENEKKAADQFNLLFSAIELPRLAAAALKELQQAQAGQLALDQKNAGAAQEVIRIGEQRIKNIKDQADAQALSIRRDADAVKNTTLQNASAEVRAAFEETVQSRLDALRRSTRTTIQQTREEIDKSAGTLRAAEATALGQSLQFQRRRADAALAGAKEILEAESQLTLGLEQAFERRKTLQDAQVRSQLAGIAEEANARREAIRAQLPGATDSERVALERELTEVTQEEATKRTEILAQAATQAIQLAQRERTERIARAEDIFSIQRTLNQRRVQDDLATQAKIAQSAEAGSKIQLDAIKRVADLQAQLQQRAQSVLNQALSVADQARQRAGVEGATFVSRSSLESDLQAQKQRDAEVRAQFERGESVRAEELRNAVGNLPFAQQFADFGSQISDVFSKAVTPLQEQFRNTLGPVVEGELASLATRATAGFEGLVTGAGTQLGNLETLFSGTIDRMVSKADAGFSQIADSIHRSIEERLARGLRDLERRS